MCDAEARNDLGAYALGTLDEAGQERVRAHLADCEQCAGELAEYEKLVEILPYGLPVAEPPDEAWQRIESRIYSERERGPRAWVGGAMRPALALAVVAALLVGGVAGWVARGDGGDDSSAGGVAGGPIREAASVLLVAPDTGGITTSGADEPGGRATVLEGQDGNRAEVVLSGLPALAPGRVYVVWTIAADGARQNAGEFAVDGSGQAVVAVPLADDLGALAGIAVTDEPPGAAAPSKRDVLAGPVFLAPRD